jgi:hypothetical protein
MSVSGISSASSSWNTASAVQDRIKGHHRGHHKPPDMSKDDLTKLDTQMKADGQDTSNLDKIISNFDTLDTSKDGKVSMSELKTGADALGIQLPQGPQGGPSGAQQAQWGPPPGLLSNDGSDSDSTDGTTSSSVSSSSSPKDQIKAMLEKLLSEFSQSNPSTGDSTASSQSGSSMSVSA